MYPFCFPPPLITIVAFHKLVYCTEANMLPEVQEQNVYLLAHERPGHRLQIADGSDNRSQQHPMSTKTAH